MIRSTTVAVLCTSTLLMAVPPAPAAPAEYPRSYWYTCGHLGIPCEDRAGKRSTKAKAKARKAREARKARKAARRAASAGQR